MAIVLQPEGGAERAAAVGAAIGSAEKKKRQQEMDFRQQMQQAAQQWELEKMLARSQQDFAQELRQEQYRYDAENRAREWEIEKAEIASRMDFAAKEKARAERHTEFLNSRKHLDELKASGRYSDEVMADLYLRLGQQYEDTGFEEVQEVLGQGLAMQPRLTPEEQAQALRIRAGLEPRATADRDGMQAVIQNLLGGDTDLNAADLTDEDAVTALSNRVSEVATNTVQLRHKESGVVGPIPANQVDAALASGKFERFVPEVKRPIPPANFEWAKKRPDQLIRDLPFFNR